jgi:hypothetical protein
MADEHLACQIASNRAPLSLARMTLAAVCECFASDGAETGGAEPHIAEQSRSWRAARWRAGGYARFLKRQLSLPVSMMSQWWVSRSSMAVVILASPNTCGQSAKARLVVISSEVFS